ncbi:ATP-binding protein [Sphingomonas sp. CL5.1]|uniref:ATP-binding protein n=1 Tax=Sphingomonas sp. CL5.1 TaxID=2653203 RepID=UPI001583986E|nr:ATP-binding protein [Sphingomonas sp. CL5.1]QKS00176.1 ATP-binding protein [Sphingomonas sp. CL5.1]
MTARIDMGFDGAGASVELDLEELLATRLLVQGNSGSGKSHLLRRLLEGSAGLVQQVIIDPEGDFVSLADAFSHIAVDAAHYSFAEIERLAARAREHRASVVLNLEGLEVDDQLRCAAAFLATLFEAPREQWFPILVVVDEAQLFAPAAAGEVGEEARRASLAAMTNLMCRGRKRGLAGVIATQRLAKLAKNVAAEASNFLMGRTFLDIDMARAADLLGMERRQADQIRDLARGEFLALGPAITRRPIKVRIGSVTTAARNVGPRLTPLPEADADGLRERLFTADETDAPPPIPVPSPPSFSELMQSAATPPPAAVPDMPVLDEAEQAAVRGAVLAEMAGEDARVPLPQSYQDYQVRCRMRGVTADEPLDHFRRQYGMARAGLNPEQDWDDVLALAEALPEEMFAPFLGLARAARFGEECPDNGTLAALYQTASPSRARRMLDFIEEKGLIVVRVDMLGKRSVSLPHLGWTTEPAMPEPSRARTPPRRTAGARRRA